MRSICWLHISDFHIRKSDAWSQDVVVKALCDDISQQREDGVAIDFILATGDIAFSGKPDDYALAAGFFDALIMASGVPKERIFCVPGNHDIDRDRQKLSFLGARTFLHDQNRTDDLLAAGEDLQTLLKRQENYRHFQNTYLTGQDRTLTADGLGYITRLAIEDVRLAIIGLDSAWLAEGGMEDHGKLLIGERQLINAIKLVQECDNPPHIIVGMAHHPLHLLQEFDRRPIQIRIESTWHFFHCGHLHEPEARTVGFSGAGCLTLAAGASFETRQSRNTYSLVTLDLLQAKRVVKTIQFNPSNGAFSPAFSEEYPIEVTPVNICRVNELAQAMITYHNSLEPWAHYLSALLLDQKSEFPILAQTGHAFSSFAVLQAQPDSELKRKTVDFMAFKNALRILYDSVSLLEIFVRHGAAVIEYGITLENICNAQPSIKARLAQQEHDAQMLASAEPSKAFSHTNALLAELTTEQEWDLLRTHAQRHLTSPDTSVAIQAKRMLAFSLANSDDAADKKSAIELYRSLAGDESPEASDAGNLATLLMETGNFVEARDAVLGAIEMFPAKMTNYFFQI